MHDDDTLSQFEVQTDPFTAAELAAIAEYREATNGVRDLVEHTDPKDLIRLGPGLDATGVRYLLAELADGLNTWYLALDKALAEMLTCTAESTGYSVAARRFLKFESAVYHQARQEFEYAVTVFLLGRDTEPTGNYPPPTVTLNLAMQCLQGYS